MNMNEYKQVRIVHFNGAFSSACVVQNLYMIDVWHVMFLFHVFLEGKMEKKREEKNPVVKKTKWHVEVTSWCSLC